MSKKSPSAPRRKRWRRRATILAVVLVVVLLLVGVLPAIISAAAPGLVQDAVNSTIAGRVRVSRVALGWLGPQEVGPIEVTDDAGQRLGTINIQSRFGLLGVVFGSRDLGVTTVSGELRITRAADGSTNLQRALAPRTSAAPGGGGSPPPARSARLPRSLKGELEVNNLLVVLEDDKAPPAGAHRAVALKDLRGRATFAVGAPAEVTLDARCLHGPSAEALTAEGGTIAIRATATGLAAADGTVTVGAATIDADARAEGLAVAVVDALLGQEGKLVAALGPSVTARLTAKGTLENATCDVRVDSATTALAISLALADGRISTAVPAMLSASTQGYAALVPTLARSLSGADPNALLRIVTYPGVSATLEFSAKSPAQGGPVDLRGASVALDIRTQPARAQLNVGPEGSAPLDYALAPLELRVASTDLGGRVAITGGGASTINGSHAGTVVVDVGLSELLDERGTPRPTGPGAMDGSVVLSGVRTAIGEAFVAPLGLRLHEDVGPEVTIELAAVGRAGSAPGAAGTLSQLELRVDSANIKAIAEGALEAGVFRTTGDDVRVEIGALGPTAARLLKGSIAIDSRSQVILIAEGLSIDLAKLAPRAGGKPDPVAAINGSARLWVGPTSGTAPVNGAARRFTLAPTSVTITAEPTLTAVKASTSGTLAGQSLGAISLDLAARGLAVQSGVESGARQAGDVEGAIKLTGVATELARALGGPAKLDLAADVGQTIDLDVSIKADLAAKGAGTIPASSAKLAVKAAKLTGSGSLAARDGAVSVVEPISLNLTDGSALAGRFAPGIAPGTPVTIRIKELRAPLESGNTPVLAGLRASATLEAPGVRILTSTGEVRLESFTASIGHDQHATIGLEADLLQGQERSSARIALRIERFYQAGPGGEFQFTPARALPVGTVMIDAPVGLVQLAGGEGGMNGAAIEKLARAALGPRAKLDASFKREGSGAEEHSRFTLGLASDRLKGGGSGKVSPAAIELEGLALDSAISPEAAEALLAALAPDLSPRPRLVQPTDANLTVGYLRFPRTPQGGLDLSQAGNARLGLKAPTPTLIDGLTLANADGTRRPLGIVGTRGLEVNAWAPLAALASPASKEPGRTDATITTTLVHSASAQEIGGLNASIKGWVVGGKPAGKHTGEVKARVTNTTWLDSALAQSGVLAAALGDRADVDAAFESQLDQAASLSTASASARINAARFTMTDPVRVAMLADRYTLQGLKGRWQVTPEMIALLTKGTGVSILAPTSLDVNLANASVARPAPGSTGGPLKGGVFALELYAASPGATATVPGGQRVALSDLKLTAGHTVQGTGVGLDISMREGDRREPIRVLAVAYGIADTQGVPTPDDAVLSGTVKVPEISTALIDALARQGGLLVEALGPTASLDATFDGVSSRSGRASAKAVSPRASATVDAGVRQDGVVQVTSSELRLDEITPALGAALFQGVPSIANVEKRREDGHPATLRIQNFTYSPDGNLRLLNGSVTLDPGPMRFETSAGFGSVLSTLSQRRAGLAGEKLEPLSLSITNGVVTYPRYALPIGEFKVETRGSVDLATRELDVITYIPLGALSDEAAGRFNTGLGTALGSLPVLDKATTIPWRTKGPVGKTSTGPDVRLFVEEFGATLLRPDLILQRGLQDILKNLPGGG